MRKDLINAVEDEFINADYRVALSRGSFDVVAAGNNSILVKVLSNIDSATETQAKSLLTAARSIDAKPMFVGTKTRKGEMEELVYHRFGVPAIAINSLQDIIANRKIFSHAGKGGSVVYIDGAKMRANRKKLGLSLGDVSREVGVSRTSIIYYENNGRARPEIVEKIECLLGSPVAINELHAANAETYEKPKGLEAVVSRKLSRIGFSTMQISKAVFNLVARSENVILANVSENNNTFRKDAQMLHDISEITGKRAVFVSQKFFRRSVEGVPVIMRSELEEINEIEALEELIEDRI
ncbi:MAG: helix-turn-helix domain-containing protein [Candidatus Aenigmatarchaeota archaeon]